MPEELTDHQESSANVTERRLSPRFFPHRDLMHKERTIAGGANPGGHRAKQGAAFEKTDNHRIKLIVLDKI
jgi:hypothetical protein